MSHARDSSGTATRSPPARSRALAVHDAQAGQRHGHRVLDAHRLARAAELHPRAVVGRAPRPVHGRGPAVVVCQPAPARVLRLRLRRQSVFSPLASYPPKKRWPFSTRAKGEATRLGTHENPLAFHNMQPRRSAVCGLCFIIRVARSSRARRASRSRAPWRRAASSARPAASWACGGRNGADFRRTRRQ